MASTVSDSMICFNLREKLPSLSAINEDGVLIRKLFVSNLAERTTIRDLQQLFDRFGQIESCYLKHGKSRFGFITYRNAESAVEARKAGANDAIHLHRRILKVLAADPWHQPDSIENKKRFFKVKKSDFHNSENSEESSESVTNFNSPISTLNDDCLVKIFLYLSIADRIRMERVCKRWQILSQESWRAVKKLQLKAITEGLRSNDTLVTTYILRKVLMRCGQFLTHLDISSSLHQLSLSTITIVGKFCPKLQFIDITALKLSRSGINSLLKNRLNIQKLVMKTLSGPFETALFDFFSFNNNLKYLGIIDDYCYITGKCLKYLHDHQIEELHFESCKALLSIYLNEAIERFNNLQSLRINACSCITDETLQAIGKKKLLKRFELSEVYPLISINEMYLIANLVNLQWLNLVRNNLVTDDLLIRISMHCKQLNCLNISYCDKVSDVGVKSLASLLKLEKLIIAGMEEVTDQAFTDLRNLKHLECQNCIKIKNNGLVIFITVAENLESLDATGCPVSLTLLQSLINTKRNNFLLGILICTYLEHEDN